MWRAAWRLETHLPDWQGARRGFWEQEVSHSRVLEFIDSQKGLSWLPCHVMSLPAPNLGACLSASLH